MKAIVIDLDGTLCNTAHREHLIGQWDEFNAGCKDDTPHPDVAWLVKMFCGFDFDEPILIGCTGRSEEHRTATERWLLENDLFVDFVLMRPAFDFRPDAEVKVELLQAWHDSTEEAEKGMTLQDRILFVLEDREKVVEAWRNLGLNCWQVREGAF